MNHESRTTIGDIAKATGVSKTTVSRYINGRQDLMSEKTRERIRKVIEITNYQPSDIARNLKRKSTNLIGVLISDMSTPFSSAMIISISAFLAEHGYVPIFSGCDDSPEKEQQMIETMLIRGVAGLLVNTTSFHNNYLISVAARGIPVVLCDRYVSNYNFPIVTVEQDASMRALVQHLQQQCYTRPVLFSQDMEDNSSRMRRKNAYLAAVQELYGYDAAGDIYLIDPADGRTALSQLEHLMADLGPRDVPAIIGINSVTTVQVYKAIKTMGINMPHEIGLCGPDDWDWQPDMNWALLVDPKVTTIFVPAQELGTQAAKMIVGILQGTCPEPQELILPCGLNVRGSTNRLNQMESSDEENRAAGGERGRDQPAEDAAKA